MQGEPQTNVFASSSRRRSPPFSSPPQGLRSSRRKSAIVGACCSETVLTGVVPRPGTHWPPHPGIAATDHSSSGRGGDRCPSTPQDLEIFLGRLLCPSASPGRREQITRGPCCKRWMGHWSGITSPAAYEHAHAAAATAKPAPTTGLTATNIWACSFATCHQKQTICLRLSSLSSFPSNLFSFVIKQFLLSTGIDIRQWDCPKRAQDSPGCPLDDLRWPRDGCRGVVALTGPQNNYPQFLTKATTAAPWRPTILPSWPKMAPWTTTDGHEMAERGRYDGLSKRLPPAPHKSS